MKTIKAKQMELVESFSIAIVVSLFNEDITSALLAGTLDRLNSRGVKSNDITLVKVPGAIELPLVIQQLAQKKHYQVIIALGAVIRGETTHYEYVCQQASHGCQKVSLEFDLPVIFGVLTTENTEQAWDRLGGAHGHKGTYTADCAIDMQQLCSQLKSLKPLNPLT